MKIQIRKWVFETNSSSIHAIAISTKKPNLENIEMVYFARDEFGWEQRTYDTTQKKANYLYEVILDCFYEQHFEIEKAKKKIKEYLKEYNIVCDFEISEDYFAWYVDHWSELKYFLDYILKSKENLINYLFWEESVIYTWHDNEEEFMCYIPWETEDRKVFVKWN